MHNLPSSSQAGTCSDQSFRQILNRSRPIIRFINVFIDIYLILTRLPLFQPLFELERGVKVIGLWALIEVK